MFRKVILASAFIGALSAPAMAADWYVIKSTADLSAPVSDGGFDPCFVTDRRAIAGEQELEGPFATQRAGLGAMKGIIGCEASS